MIESDSPGVTLLLRPDSGLAGTSNPEVKHQTSILSLQLFGELYFSHLPPGQTQNGLIMNAPPQRLYSVKFSS
jgi:hypothetical protein